MDINKIKYKVKSLFKEVPARNYLTVREDDVFLVSYPRSGNTWLRFLLGTLLYDGKVTWLNMENYIPDIYRCSDKHLLSVPSPRIIKSHHSYDKRYNKVIYLVRDVRDVLISYYNFYLKFHKDEIDFDWFLKKIIKGDLDDFGTYKDNVESWLSNQDKIKNGLLLIRFTDLKTNTVNVVKQILDFLNISKSEQEILDAINWSSFENMKKLEQKQHTQSDLFKETNKKIPFVRKGKVGQWKGILEPQQLEILMREYGQVLKKLGYID